MPEAVLAPNPVIDAPKAAPTPAPAAKPATPQPAPKTAPKQEKSVFDKLDDLAGEPKTPETQKPAEKKVEAPKEDKTKDEDFDILGDDEKAKKDAAPPVEDKTDKSKEPPKPGAKLTPWQAVEEKKKVIKTLETENNTLKEELAKLKTNPAAKPAADDPEKTAMAKRLTELEDEIRYTNYEKSTEYQEQYHKPYVETVASAVQTVTELTVTNADTGETRQATENDFWAVMQARNAQEAFDKAEALFGPQKAAYLMQIREHVRLAHGKAEKAKAEFRTKGSEREKQFREQQAQRIEAEREEWQHHNEEAVKKFPQYFTAEEGDSKGKELLEKGFKTVDQAFTGKGNPKLNSAVRMKAGAFNYVAYQYKKTQEALKAAEAKIAEYEASEPTPGDPAGDKPKKEESFFDKIDRMAEKYVT